MIFSMPFLHVKVNESPRSMRIISASNEGFFYYLLILIFHYKMGFLIVYGFLMVYSILLVADHDDYESSTLSITPNSSLRLWLLLAIKQMEIV